MLEAKARLASGQVSGNGGGGDLSPKRLISNRLCRRLEFSVTPCKQTTVRCRMIATNPQTKNGSTH
jgi:hypothetical protein